MKVGDCLFAFPPRTLHATDGWEASEPRAYGRIKAWDT
jgi:hypothetical protein